jgi:DNA-binding Lrp family transcriptional regulator
VARQPARELAEALGIHRQSLIKRMAVLGISPEQYRRE